MKLVQDIVSLTATTRLAPPGTEQPVAAAAAFNPIPMPVVANVREQLAMNANKLYGIVSPQWRTYLCCRQKCSAGKTRPRLRRCKRR